MKAFLQFGGAALGAPNGPFETVAVPFKETAIPHKGRTVSGYGKALPTPYLVQHGRRWYRVRIAQFGNAGTAYIGKPNQWLAIVSDLGD